MHPDTRTDNTYKAIAMAIEDRLTAKIRRLERTIALLAGAFYELEDASDGLWLAYRPGDPTPHEISDYVTDLVPASISPERPFKQVTYTKRIKR